MASVLGDIENNLRVHLNPWLVDELRNMTKQRSLNFRVALENKGNGKLKTAVTRPGGDSSALEGGVRRQC